ncbi:MAG: hypothetical protein GF317_17070 [Candidatus Lokiarchaeota archaeon]|nr:hypothetical protein [Candidatus Lokiarchaeota archaeon]
MPIYLPKFCPYCGEPLRTEIKKKKQFNRYRYFCDNPECCLIEIKHKRLRGDLHYIEPVFAAITEDEIGEKKR